MSTHTHYGTLTNIGLGALTTWMPQMTVRPEVSAYGPDGLVSDVRVPVALSGESFAMTLIPSGELKPINGGRPGVDYIVEVGRFELADDLTKIWHGTEQWRITAVAGYRTVAFGDSLTSPDGGAPNGQGWVAYFDVEADGRFQIVKNAGIPGNNTTQMLARVQADVIAYRPDLVTFLAGTNDLTQNVPLATMQDNVRGIWAAVKAAGATMVILSVPPRDLADKKIPETRAWNAWLREFAKAEGLKFVDIHARLVDPVTGGYRPQMGHADGLHLSRRGAATIGNAVLESFEPLLPIGGVKIPTDNVDPDNLLTNPLLLVGSDAAPTGWNFNALATGVNRTRVLDAGFAGGKAWEIAVADPPADVVSNFTQSVNVGWAVGDTLRFMIRFDIVSSDALSEDSSTVAGQKGLSVNALFFGAPSGNNVAISRFQSLAGHKGIAWADLVVPPGTTGPVQISATVNMIAGTSGVFRVGQAAIYNLTALGLA